jgi:hypothetical protein
MPTLKATPRLGPTFPRNLHRVVVDPYTMEWPDWVDTIVGMNGRLGLPRLVNPNDDWREFSERLSQFVPDAPYHEQFDDWRDWAAALRSSLVL